MTDPAGPGVRPPAPATDPDSGAGAPPPHPSRPAHPSRRVRWRAEPWLLAELFALCGFVVVQPLLEVVGGSPDFFIFHGVTGLDVVALVALFVLVPPVALWAVGVLAGLAGPRVRRAAHLGTVAALVLLFLVELGKNLTPVRGWLLTGLAAVLAAVLAFGYARLSVPRQLLRFAAIGPLVFVLLFAFASPSSAVVLGSDRPSGGGAPRATGPHPPIVMIILDEFAMLSLLDREGGVDAERFPNFARLAGDATWYRNATATNGWTPYAMPSMLSGRWPAKDQAPHYAVYPDNLFTLLGGVYDISASESIAQLCPPWHCGDRADQSRGGFQTALAESTSLLREIMSPVDPVRDPYDDFAEPTVRERLDAAAQARDERPDFRFKEVLRASQPVRFHEFVTGLRAPDAAGKPDLDFLHLLLPHTPWRYYPDGTQYHNVPGLPVDGPWWGRLALQRYLLQLQYVDRLLGETLDTLESTGRYDESLVVLTADHGVSLTPDGAGVRELGTDEPGIVELAWVPLFIKAPDQTEGVVDDRNWQHVDLLPTVADYAGVEVPWRVDGISWRREQRTTPEKTFYSTLDEVGTLDGPELLARILADPTAIPPVPPAPLPELVGTAVADHPVADGGLPAEVEEAGRFQEVDPATGVVPGLVAGQVPSEVAIDTPVAIALNGEIAAVAPVVAGEDGQRRFVGLIDDPGRFVPGENQLQLFLVPDGTTLLEIG